MTNEVARLVIREVERFPRNVIRGYNLVQSPRVYGLGGKLVDRDSSEMCQWIPPKYSELFLLGSFSRGEIMHGIPSGIEEYYLLRLVSGNGKELFLHVSDDGKRQNITVVSAIPKRVIGAILKRIGTALCDSAVLI